MKQSQIDDCKVKILENHDEFDILTQDSLLNFNREHQKEVTNKRNVLLIYFFSLMCIIWFS